ncbi:hypothetical protein DM01DRAFT_1386874 [Hesseltinella vesiculosa]|uniref:Serine/threonine-protein kinase ATR n=1 Tax=Hesseltinella vesiculosa TaxID=101127 RepID=A0A1X2G487_9FUNG|nr:hypothetical protein DM01DRAFT_1386874 [Hesseltinella vesiculosa]
METVDKTIDNILSGNYQQACIQLGKIPPELNPIVFIKPQQQQKLLHVLLDNLATNPSLALLIPPLFHSSLPGYLSSNIHSVCLYLLSYIDRTSGKATLQAVAAALHLSERQFYMENGYLLLILAFIHHDDKTDKLLYLLRDQASIPSTTAASNIPPHILKGHVTEATIFLCLELWQDNRQQILYALEKVKEWSEYRHSTSLVDFLKHFLVIIISKVNTIIFDQYAVGYPSSRRHALASLTVLINLLDGHAVQFMTQFLSVGQSIVEIGNDDGRLGYDFLKQLLKLSSAKDCMYMCGVIRTMLQYFPLCSDDIMLAMANDLTECIKYTASQRPILLHQLPDLPPFETLKPLCTWIADEKANMDLRTAGFESLVEAMQNNTVIASSFESLKCLEGYLEKYDTLSTQVWPRLSSLYDILLSIISSNAHRHDISSLAASCLGKLGGIDPSRLEPSKEKRPHKMILFDQFDCMEENITFVISLIERHLYPTFHATSVLTHDSATALHCTQYTIQCLLRAVHLTNVGHSLATWKTMPRVIQDFLTPFLVSTFELKLDDAIPMLPPLYKSYKHAFHDWIYRLYYYLYHCLVELGLSSAAVDIFRACLPSVKMGNIALTYQLIPCMVLSLIISGDKNVCSQILAELGGVLHGEGFDSDMAEGSLTVAIGITEYCRSFIRQSQQEGHITSRRKREIKSIRKFLNNIPNDLMARAAFKTKNFSLALMHLELAFRDALENGGAVTTDDLDNLCRTYIHMDDADSVTAVLAMYSKQWTPENDILLFECQGQWHNAKLCYEQVLATHVFADNDASRSLMTRYLNCLRQLGDFDRMAMFAGQVIDKTPQLLKLMNSHRLEAAWKSGQWNELKELIHLPMEEHLFDTLIARAMANLQRGQFGAVYIDLDTARSMEIDRLAQAGYQSYHQSYESVTRFQLIHDLETSISFHQTEKSHLLDQYQKSWTKKFLHGQPIYREQRKLLEFQIASFYTFWNASPSVTISAGERDLQLLLAKMARKAGDLTVSLQAILSSHPSIEPLSIKEQAKWYATNYQKDRAACVLDTPLLKNDISATLLRAKYAEAAATMGLKDIQGLYFYARQRAGNWEKPFYKSGAFYDRMSDNKKPLRYFRIMYSVAELYCQALWYGSKYYYHTMPRLLTIWLQFSEAMQSRHLVEEKKLISVIEDCYRNINLLIQRSIDRIQPYQFGLILPRLVSRLSIDDTAVTELLMSIITKVLLSYPKTTIWALQAALNATGQLKDNVTQIVENVDPQKYPNCHAIALQAYDLNRNLQAVARDDHISDVYQTTLTKFPALLQMKDLDLCIPQETALLPSLPENDPMPYSSNDPYPADLPTIQSILPDILVMRSMQQPKRITFMGNNGQTYHFLCKKNDDLRKDARTMEFNSMINKFLQRNTASRQHRLYIRTYAVIPLGEKWGLIEWINDLEALKSIVTEEWSSLGIDIRTLTPQIRQLLDIKKPEERLKSFRERILPRCPAVFYKWFLEHFPEPSLWYASRSRYVRSLAVMSIVGYVLGLGDRHAENLLFDSTNGDTVHVDLNMIFDRGHNLTVPEIVPFRLTNNLVDAMGVTKQEGIFKRACQITLDVLRKNRVQLLSVFETLAHDPITDWKKRTTVAQEAANTQMERMGKKIDSGRSVEAEVDQLISEATSDLNLSQMFIGWAPFV